MVLDSQSPIPLYYQLKQLLGEEIESGRWKPDDMLPTEQQLQEKYNVSRTTVRQAMQELELEGKIIRYRGRGTFVAKQKFSHNPVKRPTLSDHSTREDVTLGWTVLTAEWVIPPAEIAAQLRIDADENVFLLHRLRLENEVAIGHHVAYVSPVFANAIDESAFTVGGSLHYLRGHPSMEGSLANRIIEAVPATQTEVDLLDIEKGAPMLCIRRIVTTAEEEPIEVFRGLYRGDRFEYHIDNMSAVSIINA